MIAWREALVVPRALEGPLVALQSRAASCPKRSHQSGLVVQSLRGAGVLSRQRSTRAHNKVTAMSQLMFVLLSIVATLLTITAAEPVSNYGLDNCAVRSLPQLACSAQDQAFDCRSVSFATLPRFGLPPGTLPVPHCLLRKPSLHAEKSGCSASAFLFPLKA